MAASICQYPEFRIWLRHGSRYNRPNPAFGGGVISPALLRAMVFAIVIHCMDVADANNSPNERKAVRSVAIL